MVRDNRRESVYLFGAICPDRAVGAAIIMPAVNTEAMNAHLQEIGTQVAPGAHALLLCDRAGWHATSRGLQVPVIDPAGTVLDRGGYVPMFEVWFI